MRTVLFILLSVAATLSAAAEHAAARTIVLLRHGHYLPDPAADPQRGPGLSPLGVAQAQAAGDRLAGWPGGFAQRYVSPLQRARDTAALIAERSTGATFSTLNDLAECVPSSRNAAVNASVPAAELQSCAEQLDRLFKEKFVPANDREQTDLMVCHGNVIRYLITRAMNIDPQAWLQMSVGHTSITRVRIEPNGSMQVIAVGDVGHLPSNQLTGAAGDPERSLAVPALPQPTD